MKRIFVFALIAFFAAGFVGANMTEAALVGINTLSPVFSPDSDTTTSTGTTTDDVSLNVWGSLHLGQPAGTTDAASLSLYPSSTIPTAGIFGVGAQLPSALGYNLWFDYHLRTYDSSAYDNFLVVVTQDDYYWNGGTVVGGWSWGGATYLGLETVDEGPGFQAYVGVTPGDYYLNAVMDVDYLDMSWGRISDIAIEVPEPASMLLLGVGLIGLVAVRRKME